MPTFVATNSFVNHCRPGETIRMESAVAAATPADNGTYHVVVMLYGPAGFTTVEHVVLTQSLDTTPKVFGRTYTIPVTAPLGEYIVKASVRLTGSWSWQTVNQINSTFDVHDPLTYYGTHNPKLHMLRTEGNGYLPDDGREYTLITGITDEFSGTALDTDKWHRRHRDNGGTLDNYGDELQRYIDNHIVNAGTLKLHSHKRDTETWTAPNGNVFPIFDSNMIRSKTTFRYGYVEAKIKNPPGLGVWPAFWILAQDNRPCEIDVMEYVREGVNEHPNMVHGGNVHSMIDNGIRWRDDRYNAQYSYWKTPLDLSPTYFIDDWHTYGLLWERDQLICYLDGQPIVQRKIEWKHSGTEGALASIVCNLAIGGSWPTASWTVQPSQEDQYMEVDYIRVFQRSDDIQTGVANP